MPKGKKTQEKTVRVACRLPVSAVDLLEGMARRDRMVEGSQRTMSDELRDAVAIGLQSAVTPIGSPLPNRLWESDGTPYNTRGLGRILLAADGATLMAMPSPEDDAHRRSRWLRASIGEGLAGQIIKRAATRGVNPTDMLVSVVQTGIKALDAAPLDAE